jgi:hypothetical protein
MCSPELREDGQRRATAPPDTKKPAGGVAGLSGLSLGKSDSPTSSAEALQRQPRYGRVIDIAALAKLLNPGISPEDQAKVAAGAFDLLEEFEREARR